jgi:hypothetical protein
MSRFKKLLWNLGFRIRIQLGLWIRIRSLVQRNQNGVSHVNFYLKSLFRVRNWIQDPILFALTDPE